MVGTGRNGGHSQRRREKKCAEVGQPLVLEREPFSGWMTAFGVAAESRGRGNWRMDFDS